MSITPQDIEQIYIHSTPHEISRADALLHFVILRDEGFTDQIVTVLSEPFDTTYGRRMMSELIEPQVAQRNTSTILGPMVSLLPDNRGKWHQYGAVLYGFNNKNA